MLALIIGILVLFAPILMFTCDDPGASFLAFIITIVFTVPSIVWIHGYCKAAKTKEGQKIIEKQMKRTQDYTDNYGLIETRKR